MAGHAPTTKDIKIPNSNNKVRQAAPKAAHPNNWSITEVNLIFLGAGGCDIVVLTVLLPFGTFNKVLDELSSECMVIVISKSTLKNEKLIIERSLYRTHL
jgi:hypothetical protein